MGETKKPDCSHGVLPDEGANEAGPWEPPTQEEIRRRAYELYLDRVRECGGSLDDWLEAEAELLLKAPLTATDTSASEVFYQTVVHT